MIQELEALMKLPIKVTSVPPRKYVANTKTFGDLYLRFPEERIYCIPENLWEPDVLNETAFVVLYRGEADPTDVYEALITSFNGCGFDHDILNTISKIDFFPKLEQLALIRQGVNILSNIDPVGIALFGQVVLNAVYNGVDYLLYEVSVQDLLVRKVLSLLQDESCTTFQAFSTKLEVTLSELKDSQLVKDFDISVTDGTAVLKIKCISVWEYVFQVREVLPDVPKYLTDLYGDF